MLCSLSGKSGLWAGKKHENNLAALYGMEGQEQIKVRRLPIRKLSLSRQDMRAAWARAMVEEVAVACLSCPTYFLHSSPALLPCLVGIILITLILLLLFEARFEKLGWGRGAEFSRLKD